MSKFKKADWQGAATKLGIKFQKDDSVNSLVERIALNLKSESSTLTAVQKAYESRNVKAEKPATKPATAPAAKKVAKGMKAVKIKSIVFDKPQRKEICIQCGDAEVWVPRDKVEVSKDGKTVTMPDWLADLKGL
jgi:hypothetical protein